jgi:hypothetical protein
VAACSGFFECVFDDEVLDGSSLDVPHAMQFNAARMAAALNRGFFIVVRRPEIAGGCALSTMIGVQSGVFRGSVHAGC